ncbi:elongation factor P 5-aminopentanone reductase [Haloimpatiens massiliensis]|uniref:elongation factor P 5-aminopentanone reductase n=1 Tax=Haloimpatiens massiliensis TaxID=1658110 RepID=UPI000C82DCE3|nr:SDR family oxidoreductase [Haloimpatiens massiliensis]
MSLGGKIALVTGASRGIGRSIAIELGKRGANVIVNYKEDQKGAEETVELINENGGRGFLYKGDVSNHSFCKSMIEDIIKRFSKLDILVNNAGISKVGLFMDLKEEEFDEIMNVNFKGVFNCCHAVVEHMINRKKGTIVNISSIWGNVGASCEVIYSASKGAVNSFTKALAKELAPSGIRVNAVSPGVIDTQMNKCFSTEEKEALIEEIPMMRMGQGEDIGEVVGFLCDDSSRYVTGQIITVDGGFL